MKNHEILPSTGASQQVHISSDGKHTYEGIAAHQITLSPTTFDSQR